MQLNWKSMLRSILIFPLNILILEIFRLQLLS